MVDARRELLNRLEPVICRVRDRRLHVEGTWTSNHAAWRGQRTEFYYDSPQFKHYIPVGRKAIERSVVRMRQMLVPENDFFEVYPGDQFDQANSVAADAVSTYINYLMSHRIRIKALVSQLSRCLLLYGRAVTKASIEVVHWSEDTEGTVQHMDIWPTLRAVDPFAFYQFPETTTDLDRCQLLFEDVMYPWSDYLDAVEHGAGLIDGLRRRDLEKPEWPNHHLQRLQLGLIASPSDMSEGDVRGGEAKEVGDFVQLTEGYMKYQQSWMQFWIVWNLKHGPRIVRLHEIAMPRQPYRLAVAREVPGEAYNTAMMDDIKPLQILANDQFNRMEEAASLAAVPPVTVDPNRVTRADSLVFRPRAKWLTEKDGVGVLGIPDTSRGSQAAVVATLNLINSVFSPGGATEGQPPRGSPRAGFAFSAMTNLAMADIKDNADILEEALLTPALHDLYVLTIKFVPPEQVIKIPGAADYAPRTMTTYDLYGGWNFKWVGQLQAQDMQVRGQRMEQFLQGSAPLIEPLMGQGWQMDFAQLLKMIWRNVLGERGFDRILVKMPPPQPPMLPPGMTPPGAQGPQAGAGGNPMQAMAGMVAEGGSAATPENRVRQQSRKESSTRGGRSQ